MDLKGTKKIYSLFDDQCTFVKGKILYQSEDFPTDDIHAIVSCFFRPKNRNNKLEEYIKGISDISHICNYVNNENYSDIMKGDISVFAATRPRPKFIHKLCFVLYVDESINDTSSQETAKETAKIHNSLNFRNTRSHLSFVPIRIQSIQYASKFSYPYHMNMFPTIFRHTIPMIDPHFKMAMCIDLDTASFHLNAFKKYLSISVKKQFINAYGNQDGNTIQFEYARTVVDALCDQHQYKASVHNITRTYTTPHSWDIFNLKQHHTNPMGNTSNMACPSYFFETLYTRMKDHRPLFIEMNIMLDRILTSVENKNRELEQINKIVMPNLSISTTSLEEIEDYVIYRLGESYHKREPKTEYMGNPIKLFMKEVSEELSCGGDKPYQYFKNNTYGFDEIVINCLFMPIYVQRGLYFFQQRYTHILNLPRLIREPVEGAGISKHKYKGRLYKIRTGTRGGRYILVEKVKIYICPS
jgi:hypothetical protein